jgi:hypothetical protein
MPSLKHNRQGDQADHIFGWAKVRPPKSVVKVGSKIETSPAIVGENSNVFVTDGETRRLRRSE